MRLLQDLPHGLRAFARNPALTATLGFPGELPQNGIYFPSRQRRPRCMSVSVHAEHESAALVRPLEDLTRGLDPDVPASGRVLPGRRAALVNPTEALRCD